MRLQAPCILTERRKPLSKSVSDDSSAENAPDINGKRASKGNARFNADSIWLAVYGNLRADLSSCLDPPNSIPVQVYKDEPSPTLETARSALLQGPLALIAA